mmetsp:Transcript_44225/g.140885  ORF Transcript_44225/g.140885 Transcript_44225/m.140885 type:complete len:247 (+) Transcript_44225:644-1384(+)
MAESSAHLASNAWSCALALLSSDSALSAASRKRWTSASDAAGRLALVAATGSCSTSLPGARPASAASAPAERALLEGIPTPAGLATSGGTTALRLLPAVTSAGPGDSACPAAHPSATAEPAAKAAGLIMSSGASMPAEPCSSASPWGCARAWPAGFKSRSWASVSSFVRALIAALQSSSCFDAKRSSRASSFERSTPFSSAIARPSLHNCPRNSARPSLMPRLSDKLSAKPESIAGSWSVCTGKPG